MACKYCDNATTNKKLTKDNDLSYCCIGDCEKHISMFVRTGAGKPTIIGVDKFMEKDNQNHLIGYYEPKYCPECGRKLTENIKE